MNRYASIFSFEGISMNLGENVHNFLRTLHKCNTSIVNADLRSCDCFLQQLSCELTTLLCSTTLLFFTALVW